MGVGLLLVGPYVGGAKEIPCMGQDVKTHSACALAASSLAASSVRGHCARIGVSAVVSGTRSSLAARDSGGLHSRCVLRFGAGAIFLSGTQGLGHLKRYCRTMLAHLVGFGRSPTIATSRESRVAIATACRPTASTSKAESSTRASRRAPVLPSKTSHLLALEYRRSDVATQTHPSDVGTRRVTAGLLSGSLTWSRRACS